MIYLYCAVLKIQWQIWVRYNVWDTRPCCIGTQHNYHTCCFKSQLTVSQSKEQETFWEPRQIVSLTEGGRKKKKRRGTCRHRGAEDENHSLLHKLLITFQWGKTLRFLRSFSYQKQNGFAGSLQSKSLNIDLKAMSWPALKTSVGHKYRADNGIRKEGHRKSLRGKIPAQHWFYNRHYFPYFIVHFFNKIKIQSDFFRLW